MTAQLPAHLFPLMRQLADGRFHSGEALAREFGISRSSVFNAFEQATTLGARIQAVRGRGYRLAGEIDWLDAGRVAVLLGPLTTEFHLNFHDTLASTNAWLLARAGEGAASATVCATEHQYAGRGRRGRVWHTELGGSLAFSVLYRFESGVSALAGLSLAVGLALARALNRHAASPVALKWPNDLVFGAQKLGGVLVEVQGDMDGPALAVIGVGLNLRLSPARLAEIDQPVIDLAGLGGAVERNRLLADCLTELHGVLATFRTAGFAALRDDWMALDAYRELPVRLLRGECDTVYGTAVGVDVDGALLLRDAAGQRTRHSGGELSLRLAG